MSHYAIIKRQKYISTPNWVESLKVLSGDSIVNCNIVKKESFHIDCFGITFENVIRDELTYDSIISHWEGRIKLEPLLPGEAITVNGERFMIKKVDKDVKGSVSYLVDDLIVKHDNYENIMQECEVNYGVYSKLLNHEKRVQKVEKDILSNDDYQKELLKNKPWWVRLFK